MSGSPRTVGVEDPFADASGIATNLPFATVGNIDTTGAVNAQPAIQAVVNAYAALGLGVTIWLPSGDILLNDELLISGQRINFRGNGKQATRIKFMPSAHDKSPFHYTSGAAVNYQSSVRDLTVYSTDTSFRKIAIFCEDVSEFLVENFATYPFSDASHGTVGIKMNGRELTQITACSLSADQPIQFGHNPNTAVNSGTEDADVVHLRDLILYPHSSRYSVLVDDGAMPTAFVWDGANDSNGGKGAFYYRNTTVPNVGNTFVIAGTLRVESAAGGEMVHFEAGNSNPASYRSVDLSGVHGGSGDGGFYIRGVTGLTIRNCAYLGTGAGLDVAVCYQYTGLNNFWRGGSTRTMTGMYEIFTIEDSYDGTAPGHPTEYWTATTNSSAAAGNVMSMGGVRRYSEHGTVQNGIGNRIAIKFGGGAQTAGIIRVFAHGATKDAFGIVGISATGGALLIGNANFDYGNVGGKLTVFFENSAVITLANQSGEDMSYGYVLERF